jgi:hypothetical protein
MLAAVEELLDYDLVPKSEILEEVRHSSHCALCGLEPLQLSASYGETIAWLEDRDPLAADDIRRSNEQGAGGSASVGWHDTRKTYAFDSKISPGYAISDAALAAAMSRMEPDRQEFFADTFLVAICDVCAVRAATEDAGSELLLQSYVNQRAGGSIAVARAQPVWAMVESTARLID